MPPIVLRWTPTRTDIDDALAVYRTSSGGSMLLVPYLGPFMLLLLGTALFLLDRSYLAIAVAVVAVFFTLFAGKLAGRGLWRNPLVRQPAEAVVDPTALRVSTDRSATTWQWSSFEGVVETEHSFVLLGGKHDGARPNLFAYLPKRAVADPRELDRLRALLGSVLTPR